MAVHYTILSLKLIFLIAVFVFTVEGDGVGNNQQFDLLVEDTTENHLSHG